MKVSNNGFIKKLDLKRMDYCEKEALADANYRSVSDKVVSESKILSGLKKAAWIFIILFMIDCCITGGGRLIDFGYVSYRMLVFAGAFITSLPLVIINRKRLIKEPFVWLTILFGAVLVIWSVYGYLNNSPVGHIRSDITSCLTLALVPGMLCVVDSREKILKLVDVIFYSSVVLAVIITALQFLVMHYVVPIALDFGAFMADRQIGGFAMLQTGTFRVYFRSGIYSQVAIMLGIWKVWHAEGLKKKILLILCEGILVYAWIVSYTRGFWLGLGASVIFVLIWQPKIFGKCFKIAVCSLLVAAVITGLSWINEGAPNVPKEFYNRIVITVEQSSGSEHGGKYSPGDVASQDIRERTVKAEKEYIRQYPIFGRGIGAYLVGVREESAVEYTYLDVMMKLGAVGTVFFTLAFLVFLRKAFMHRVFRPKELPENKFYTLTTLVIAAYAGVAVTSITNPFLISPLGLSLLLVTEAAVYNCRINNQEVV